MFFGYARTGWFFPWPSVFMFALALLHVWYYDMELTPISSVLLLFSACSMTRGQEETSTSQAGRRRGPRWDTPSASSMEELRSYCQISGNFDIELSDRLVESTIGEGDDAVYFTWEQLVVGLRFLVSSLIK